MAEDDQDEDQGLPVNMGLMFPGISTAEIQQSSHARWKFIRCNAVTPIG